MVYIITGKGYKHYNRALGKEIRTKGQYEREMRNQGMIPKEQADNLARKKTAKKPYTPSKDAYDIIKSCKVNKKGNAKLPPRAIERLRSMGMETDQKKINRIIKEGGI